MRVPVREAAFGILLWGSVPGILMAALPACLAALGTVVLWTRWFGMVQPRGWFMAVREGLPLWAGVVCFAGFLWFCLGSAPWWG